MTFGRWFFGWGLAGDWAPPRRQLGRQGGGSRCHASRWRPFICHLSSLQLTLLVNLSTTHSSTATRHPTATSPRPIFVFWLVIRRPHDRPILPGGEGQRGAGRVRARAVSCARKGGAELLRAEAAGRVCIQRSLKACAEASSARRAGRAVQGGGRAVQGGGLPRGDGAAYLLRSAPSTTTGRSVAQDNSCIADSSESAILKGVSSHRPSESPRVTPPSSTFSRQPRTSPWPSLNPAPGWRLCGPSSRIPVRADAARCEGRASSSHHTPFHAFPSSKQYPPSLPFPALRLPTHRASR